MTPLHKAQITSIKGSPTQVITLRLNGAYTFRAGQYLEVVAPDGIRIPLSIASAPARLPELELHYRTTPGVDEARAMDRLLEGNELLLSPATGDVRAGAPHQEMLIVAGGTGAAQAFSCAEYRAGSPGQTTILWCADHAADLYDTQRLNAYANVRLHTIVDDKRTPENEGLVWLRKNASQFAAGSGASDSAYILLAGGPPFVYAVLDVLLEHGVHQAQCHADAFTYAPRH